MFLKNLNQFMELKPTIVAPEQRRQLPAKMTTGITFENVSFTYPGQKQPVFTNLSFSIPAGKSTAIVGENGAGKTTIVKLLSRLYDPEAGRICLNGIDIREYDPAEYRKRISVILQDFVHYQLTVTENIEGLGHEGDPSPAGIKAAELAGLTSLIESLPAGWDTSLGKQFDGSGRELSGGQWQRVALARAVCRPSDLIVLDEPTSALDAAAEAEVTAWYEELLDGRTALLISHRFNTVLKSNNIIVLDSGNIVEQGAHAELMGCNGLYAKMFRTQAEGISQGLNV